ncbi:MAG: iron-containing alcohol dehydrogenase [Eubacterium sp.]|nr:iron-containing alcohol dehydrogenase [Eubacterium sp.]
MSAYLWNTFCPTLFGTGASKEAGNEARKLGMTKVMVCTEQALIEFGVATQVIEVLKGAGLDVYVFDRCRADAPGSICDEGAAFVRQHGIDGIVAVGGGSTLDTAKAIGIIISQNGTTIRDYYHLGEDKHEMKLITLCTTSGTGSEISQWAVIGDEVTGAKEMPVYKPDMAIVDPVLTYSLPAGPTAATGMDVIAHCVEAITNRNYNPYGYIFGKEGIRLAMKYLPIAVKDPENAESREKMSLAANLGGMAISACGCSIGHSFSQTFGAMHHIPHGLGCAWGLPGVMIYSAEYGERKNLEEVADAMQVPYTDETDTMELAETMAKMFVDLMKELKIKSIRESGYSPEDCLAAADRFAHDGAFGNSPGNPGMNEIEAFIRYTYEAY